MTMQRGSAVIEFVGLAGVGKSTLSHRVAEILQQRGWQVEQPTYSVDHEMRAWRRLLLKLRLVTAEAIFHPACAVHSAKAILATRQASAADVIRLTVDRKSTRLNSSHLVISYAVFCLKKKNKHTAVFLLLFLLLPSAIDICVA